MKTLPVGVENPDEGEGSVEGSESPNHSKRVWMDVEREVSLRGHLSNVVPDVQLFRGAIRRQRCEKSAHSDQFWNPHYREQF